MTVQEMQALREAGYTVSEVMRLSGCCHSRVAKNTRCGERLMTPLGRVTWAWLYEQEIPVRAGDAAQAMGVRVDCMERRLRRLRSRGLAIRVGFGLWVAMDHDPMTRLNDFQETR